MADCSIMCMYSLMQQYLFSPMQLWNSGHCNYTYHGMYNNAIMHSIFTNSARIPESRILFKPLIHDFSCVKMLNNL
jgi:hypothetical protein